MLRRILIVFLLTVGSYWKLALTNQYIWFDHPDMTAIELPRLQFQASQIQRGRFPLWDPMIWCGQPLIGQTQPGPLFPLNLLFFLLPLHDGQIRVEFLNGYFVLIHFLAALFCYALCRDQGLGTAGSVAAGCAFSFGGFLGTVPWLDVVNGGIWTPLILLYLLRSARGERPAASAALAGLWLGVAWLSGHHELPLLVSLLCGIAWILFCWRRPSLIRHALLMIAIAGLVSAAQLWPTIEFGRLSVRWVGVQDPAGWNDRVAYTIHTLYSLPAKGLLETFLPTYARHADTSPFQGAAVTALALTGLLAAWGDRRTRWLAGLLALALVYALGALSPVHGVLYALSAPLAKARVTVRAIHLSGLAIALLAGVGLDRILRREGSRIPTFAAAVTGAAILAQAAWALINGLDPDQRMLTTGISAAGTAAALTLWPRSLLGAPALLATLFLLMFMELTGLTSFPHRFEGNQVKHAATLSRNADIAEFLRAQNGPVRIHVREEDVPENYGDWRGIEMLQGYVAGVPRNLVDAALHGTRIQQLFGVTHVVGKKPFRDDQPPVFAGASGVQVFRNPGAFPRARSVHQAVQAKDPASLRAMIDDPAFDLHNRAVMTAPAPALEQCAEADDIRLVRHNSDRVTINAKMACRGMVIVGDSFYPGWRATIDGNRAPVLEVYGAMRGIVVERGQHTIDMLYRPASIIGGLALTLLGVFAAVAVSFRREAPKTPPAGE